MDAIEVLIININKLCKSKGWKYRTLAKTMGIPAESLSRSLNGNPRLDTIEKMAKALDVPVRALFDDPEQIEGYITLNGQPVRFHTKEELLAMITKQHLE